MQKPAYCLRGAVHDPDPWWRMFLWCSHGLDTIRHLWEGTSWKNINFNNISRMELLLPRSTFLYYQTEIRLLVDGWYCMGMSVRKHTPRMSHIAIEHMHSMIIIVCVAKTRIQKNPQRLHHDAYVVVRMLQNIFSTCWYKIQLSKELISR